MTPAALLTTALYVAAHTAALQEQQAKERRAFIRLAWQQRKNAALYRGWAKEAERDGNLEQYRKYAAMAKTSFRDARLQLEQARMRHA